MTKLSYLTVFLNLLIKQAQHIISPEPINKNPAISTPIIIPVKRTLLRVT